MQKRSIRESDDRRPKLERLKKRMRMTENDFKDKNEKRYKLLRLIN